PLSCHTAPHLPPFLLLLLLRPPTSPLFPYTTLFRSLSSRPLGFGRDSLHTPMVVKLDLRVLKYFPFGGLRRLDVVAESFNLRTRDRKSTRLNSSHRTISYAVFCLKKKKNKL